ncbi:MAG: single-stranded DNA-binding protein [Bacteroidota bacterium]
MAINNTAILTGNLGSEAKIIENRDKTFASLSIATTDSYQNDQQEWVNRDTIWHDVLIFNPKLIKQIKAFKKGTRLKVTGSISYRTFEVSLDGGRTVKKKEASIIAKVIEQAPLVKKADSEN